MSSFKQPSSPLRYRVLWCLNCLWLLRISLVVSLRCFLLFNIWWLINGLRYLCLNITYPNQVDPPFESNISSKPSCLDCLVKQGMEVEDELVKERRAEMVECKQGCHMIRRICVASLTLYCNLRNVSIVTICASLTVSNVKACLNNFPLIDATLILKTSWKWTMFLLIWPKIVYGGWQRPNEN